MLCEVSHVREGFAIRSEFGGRVLAGAERGENRPTLQRVHEQRPYVGDQRDRWGGVLQPCVWIRQRSAAADRPSGY